MLMTVGIALFGISVFWVVSLVFMEESQFKAQEKLEGDAADDQEIIKQQGIILRYSRPFFRRYVSPIVSSMKNKKKNQG